MKKIVLMSFLLLFMHSSAQKQQSPIRAIIFDIHGVLFQEDSMAFAKKIGLGAISSYTVSHWKNPVNTCLDTLDYMSKDADHAPRAKLTFENRQMPSCIVEWQCGRKNYQEVHSELCSYWCTLSDKNYFKSKKEREITESVLRIALDPKEFAAITKPIDTTLRLVQELKKKGYKVYMTGNLPKEPYEIMLNAYPQIKQLFDSIHVSSQLGFIKPDGNMFAHVARIHNLKAEECLVLDDEKVNISLAQKAGMQTILFQNAKQTEKILKKQGIL